MARGDYDKAIGYYQASIELFRQIKQWHGLAFNLQRLATALTAAGRSEEATTILRQAEEFATRAGETDLLASLRAQEPAAAAEVGVRRA